MKTLTIASIAFATSLSVFSATANARDVIGKVVAVEEAPYLCTERRDNLSSTPVVMAVAGGLTGNQFGDGNGKVALTALGAIAGAALGSANRRHNEDRIDCQFDGYINVIEYKDRHGNTYQTTRQTQYAMRVGSRLNIRIR
jgi:uncharacterized protein YcfJ